MWRLLAWLWLWISWLWRRVSKGVLRRTTGLCELQRVCYGERPGAPRTAGLERSLRMSRDALIGAVVESLDAQASARTLRADESTTFRGAANLVMRAKRINRQSHPDFAPAFERCAALAWGYQQLMNDVEAMRTTQYDSESPHHERKLLQLWRSLMPDDELEHRITKRWQDIGFQGDDPKTDFRGMGMLGLENLLYFAEKFPGPAAHVLSHSHHPQYGYTFAVVGINLTSVAYDLLKDGSARTYVYNMCRDFPTIETFHKMYCYLFYEFDRYWIESKPRDMMEFSDIRQRFEKNIREALKNKTSVFRINIKIDNI